MIFKMAAAACITKVSAMLDTRMLIKIMNDGRPLHAAWYSFAGTLGTHQVISISHVSAMH